VTADDDRRDGWRLLRTLAGAERRALAVSIVAAVGWLGCGMAVPLVLGWSLQRSIVDGDVGAVWIGAALLVAFGVAEAGADALRHWFEIGAEERTRARLRHAVAVRSLDLDEPDRDRWPPGQVTARATSDTDAVAGGFQSLGYTVAYVLAVPVIVALLLAIDPVIAGVVVLAVIVNVASTWRLSASWERRVEADQAALGDTIAAAQSALEGFKVIAGAGAQAGVVARYVARSAHARERAVAAARWWLPFGPLLAGIGGLTTVTVVVVGGIRVIDGHLGIGAMVSALGLALFLDAPVRATGESITGVRVLQASARRLVALIGATPSLGGAVTAAPAVTPAGAPRLVVDDATFEYPDTDVRFRLAPVTFAASPGDVVVLRGPIGSGKSTVAALVAGDRRPTSGRVLLGDIPVTDLPADVRRRAVLRLGPEPFLLLDTIAANVRLGAPDATDEAVADALAAAHAAEFVDRLPDGAGTVLADRGSSLSGGQRQRLSLARALVARPDVLVLDGALSGLDPDREHVVLSSVVDRWRHGIVVLVSVHPTAAALATRLVDLPAPTWQTARVVNRGQTPIDRAADDPTPAR
jgi:ABC-type multidrug transport system fused ATPase/permease subunit